MREFRRSRKVWVLTIIWSVFVLGALLLGAEAMFKFFNVPADILDKCMGVWVFYFVICMIIHATFPEDFEYYVEVRDNILIFDFSENDRRVISTPFWILSKNRRFIVISDGWARITLMYNKSVLRFLNKYIAPQNQEVQNKPTQNIAEKQPQEIENK